MTAEVDGSVSLADFQPWPKTPRLRRDITITEKIDGTNAQISVREITGLDMKVSISGDEYETFIPQWDRDAYWIIKAGSRNRWVRPGADNAGFGAWVHDNAQCLAELLGVGRHYGEWWGAGIQGNPYQADGKTFSLFNSRRWGVTQGSEDSTKLLLAQSDGLAIGVVPELYVGPWDDLQISACTRDIGASSRLNPFSRGEGVIVYHHASKMTFKVLAENDDISKTDAMAAA